LLNLRGAAPEISRRAFDKLPRQCSGWPKRPPKHGNREYDAGAIAFVPTALAAAAAASP